MKYSDSNKEAFNFYDRPMISQIPYGGIEPTRPGFGSFSLLITAVIILVIVIVLFVIPQLFSSDNDDVSYSGLGINYRYQKQEEWIYFTAFSFSNYPEGIWRVRSNGEDRMQIYDGEVDLFKFYSDHILYTTRSYKDGWALHIIRTEDSDERVLYQSNEKGSSIAKVDVTNAQCYALDVDNRLHIINLDSGELSEYIDYISDFCIDGDWIYYLRIKPDSDEKLFQLWRTNIDRTQNQQLMKSFESAVDYSNNKAYYINKNDGDIYSIDFSGGKEQKLIETEGRHYIKIIGDWIFYENQGDKSGIYKVKKDGRNDQRVSDFEARIAHKDNIADPLLSMRAVSILDNWFWYYDMSDSGTSLCKMIRINDTYATDDVIEDTLEDSFPADVIRKYE